MSLSAALRRQLIAAAREFNCGRYFEAHEVLEEALDDVPEDLWELFIGLIQIAVGYHKLSQGLLRGARAMLERGSAKVASFPADAAALNLEALRKRVQDDLEALRLGRLELAALGRQPPRLQPLP